jgi:hypothetical protein
MKNDRAQGQLAHHLETALGQALLGMTGAAFTVFARDQAAETAHTEESFLWQQSFTTVEGPAFWVAAGKAAWESLGSLTLVAAGVETPPPEDCRSTWQETVNQTMAALATGIGADMEREITTEQGEELHAEPPNLIWMGSP